MALLSYQGRQGSMNVMKMKMKIKIKCFTYNEIVITCD